MPAALTQQRGAVLSLGAGQGLTLLAFGATHIDLVEVVAGAGLIEPEILLAVAPGAAMGKAIPVDIAEVAVGAALHEAHGHDFQILCRAAGFPPGKLVFDQALLVDQRAGAVSLARFIDVGREGVLLGLGDEPERELRGADAAAAPEFLGEVVVFTGGAFQQQGAHAQQTAQLGDQPRFIDVAAVVVAAVVPEVEPTDHD